ncbi:hypothetical protein QX99_01227 [Weissella cibaria]|uniref:Uncharacterized protein n=1 Tax=Weissella cibaria TaxID=137591 RepID=A0A0D1K5Z6_9LACO|nr:hypothetical protein QX99_01227 [Weissella cibaria]
MTLTAYSDNSKESEKFLKEIVKVSNDKVKELWDVKNVKALGQPHSEKKDRRATLLKYSLLAGIGSLVFTWIVAVVYATYKKVKNSSSIDA